MNWVWGNEWNEYDVLGLCAPTLGCMSSLSCPACPVQTVLTTDPSLDAIRPSETWGSFRPERVRGWRRRTGQVSTSPATSLLGGCSDYGPWAVCANTFRSRMFLSGLVSLPCFAQGWGGNYKESRTGTRNVLAEGFSASEGMREY